MEIKAVKSSGNETEIVSGSELVNADAVICNYYTEREF